jgi:cytochrome bd-type quinol oxidase subunit 2
MNRENENWIAWPVSWSAVWVGTLAALAIALLIGLIGYAVGAHEMSRFVDWKKMRLTGLVFSIGGAFFSFVVGGWVAARIAGIRRSEPAMLHGAMVWLVAVPLLLGLAASAGATHFGGWYGGLATAAPSSDPQSAIAVRNSALAAVTALVLGLVGSVIGGWMASGEPMSLAYHRRRDLKQHVAAAPRTAAQGATPWR